MAPAPRILLVEDHLDSRELLEEFLLSQEFRVATASNGLEALERLTEGVPDVVLLDLMMPVMSGWELVRRMRAEPAWARVPLVVVSGAGNASPLPEGVAGALPKPVDLDALMVLLDRLLTR